MRSSAVLQTQPTLNLIERIRGVVTGIAGPLTAEKSTRFAETENEIISGRYKSGIRAEDRINSGSRLFLGVAKKRHCPRNHQKSLKSSK